jgi:hypothetical protein
MSTWPRELQELQTVEQRLLKERQEAEKLEEQIRRLAVFGASDSAAFAPPTRRAPPVPPNASSPSQQGRFLQSGADFGVTFAAYDGKNSGPQQGGFFDLSSEPTQPKGNNIGGVTFAASSSASKKVPSPAGNNAKPTSSSSAPRRRFDYGDDDSEEDESEEDDEDEDDDGNTAGTTETEKEERRRAFAKGDYSKVKSSGYGQGGAGGAAASGANSGLRVASKNSRKNAREEEEDSEEEDDDSYYSDEDDDEDDESIDRRGRSGRGGGRRRGDRSPEGSEGTGTYTKTTSSSAAYNSKKGTTSRPRGPLGLAPVSADSPINMHKRQASATGRAGVAYRSPLYRSVSPNRKVGKEKVVISNFARAPRFREEKAWVPGALSTSSQ